MYSIVFFGSDEFSVATLKALIVNKQNVVAVVTKPDKAKKRNKVVYNPVKKYVLENHPQIPLLQPAKASTDEFTETIKEFSPDLFVVVSYGEIISQALLDIPKVLPVNIHPSLLPKYRGASPLRSALLNRDKQSGIAIIEMVKKMDAGAILHQKNFSIFDNETHSDLEKRVHEMSGELLLDWLESVKDNDPEKIEQVGEVTFTKKFETADRKLDFSEVREIILGKICAFGTIPGAFVVVEINGKKESLKILKAVDSSFVATDPGNTEEFTKNGWHISTGSGCIRVLEVQRENKKACSIKDFFNGLKGNCPEIHMG